MTYGRATITGTKSSRPTLRIHMINPLITSSHGDTCPVLGAGDGGGGGANSSRTACSGNPACSSESGVTRCDGSLVITASECRRLGSTNQTNQTAGYCTSKNGDPTRGAASMSAMIVFAS